MGKSIVLVVIGLAATLCMVLACASAITAGLQGKRRDSVTYELNDPFKADRRESLAILACSGAGAIFFIWLGSVLSEAA